MAKYSRNRGKADRKTARYRTAPDEQYQDEVIIDISTFPRKHSGHSAQQFHSLIQPRNEAQRRYMAAIRSHQLVFGLGPAGTGKTFCAAAMAADALEHRRVRQIIFTRPVVESGERLGFLPGRVLDKVEPYFGTFRSYLNDLLGRGVVECAVKNGRIEFEPLAFMRGKTFEDAFVILDEAQNCTRVQLKMFLTRIGENSCVVVNGDTQQTDIAGNSGLTDAALRLTGLGGVHVHRFGVEDVVRSHLVRGILERYATN